jgi:hypothetical protein
MKNTLMAFCACGAIGALVLAGCKGDEAPAPKPKAAMNEDQPHTHGEGPHGGTIADWGGGKFHVEFTVDHDKKEATVYVLGDDAKTAAPVAANEGQLLLSIDQPAFQVVLKGSPESGAASMFVGTHDSLGVVQEFSGTISGEIDGTPYAGDFKEEPHDH